MSLITNLKSLKRQSKNQVRRLKYSSKCLFNSDKASLANLTELGSSHSYQISSYNGLLPTKLVTSEHFHSMTTFFDIDPISDCGRYLVVTLVPFIDRIPFLGDIAQVCVVDLVSGDHKVIYNTRGWGTQLGANTQWGKDKNTVYCNDIIEDKAVGIKINVNTLEVRYLEGPIYTLDSNKTFSYGANLKLINALMPGYGVPEPIFKRYRQNELSTQKDGVWRTNLSTGKAELFISIKAIIESISNEEKIENATFYLFHIKLNQQNTKLFIVLFAKGVKGRLGATLQLVVYDLKTKNIKLILKDAEWSKGGHHPNWMPNGEDILMNLKYPDKTMRFVKINSSTGEKDLLAESHIGGGHPSVSSNSGYLLTDAYISEGLTDNDGKVPIRLIDLTDNSEKYISRIFTNRLDGPCRIDPHPVWSQKHRKIIWNGIENGKRRVFIADASSLCDECS
jgi:hypothetical protein